MGQVAPHIAEELVLREDALRLAGQSDEQRELLLRKGDARPGDTDNTRRQVDLDRPSGKPLPRLRLHTAKDCTDPLDKLVVVERTREIVVATTNGLPLASVTIRKPD